MSLSSLCDKIIDILAHWPLNFAKKFEFLFKCRSKKHPYKVEKKNCGDYDVISIRTNSPRHEWNSTNRVQELVKTPMEEKLKRSLFVFSFAYVIRSCYTIIKHNDIIKGYPLLAAIFFLIIAAKA